MNVMMKREMILLRLDITHQNLDDLILLTR